MTPIEGLSYTLGILEIRRSIKAKYGKTARPKKENP